MASEAENLGSNPNDYQIYGPVFQRKNASLRNLRSQFESGRDYQNMKRKFCRLCQKSRKISKFAWKSRVSHIRNSYCKGCQNILSRKHYRKNKKKYFKRNDDRREAFRISIIKYLLKNPCVECGESDPVLLEFDHRNRNEKSNNVAVIAKAAGSWDSLWKEIKKCDVRCVKCHRKKTARESGWQERIDKWLVEINETI